jgi:signal recognition particle GTPase
MKPEVLPTVFNNVMANIAARLTLTKETVNEALKDPELGNLLMEGSVNFLIVKCMEVVFCVNELGEVRIAIQVEGADPTATTLHEHLYQYLADKNIPINNIDILTEW